MPICLYKYTRLTPHCERAERQVGRWPVKRRGGRRQSLTCIKTQSQTMFCFMPKAAQKSLAQTIYGRYRILAATGAAVLALAAAGCSARASGDVSGSQVINAIGAENEYANVLSQIGGRYVHVSSILENPNTDPHTFEASPAVVREVAAATLIVQNGVGYDSWISRMESAAPNPGRKVIVVQHVLGLPDNTPNPHLWYSPTTMPAAARAMATDLATLQPGHKAYFLANLSRFDKSLVQLQNAIGQFKAKHA